MTETTNLHLKKPEFTEPADIRDINSNMDIIDEKVAFSVDAFIPCTATYDSVAKQHALVPTRVDIELPEVFTLRFTASAAFTAGDKIYISGKEYTPAYTDSADAAITGVWLAGVPVGITCVQAVAKAFVGTSMATKVSRTEKDMLYRTSHFTSGALLDAIKKEVLTGYSSGSVKISSDIALSDCPVRYGAASYTKHGTEMISVEVSADYTDLKIYRQALTATWEWIGSNWTTGTTATPPQEFAIPFINGLSAADECKNKYWINQMHEVSIISSYKKGGVSDDVPNTTQIMSLPPQYCPSERIRKPAQVVCDSSGLPGGFMPAMVYIEVNGGVSIHLPIHVPYKTGNFGVTFVAGGQN